MYNYSFEHNRQIITCMLFMDYSNMHFVERCFNFFHNAQHKQKGKVYGRGGGGTGKCFRLKNMCLNVYSLNY